MTRIFSAGATAALRRKMMRQQLTDAYWERPLVTGLQAEAYGAAFISYAVFARFPLMRGRDYALAVDGGAAAQRRYAVL